MFNIDSHGSARLYKSKFAHYITRNNVTCAYHSLKLHTEYFPTFFLDFIQQCIQSTAIEALSQLNPSKQPEALSILERLCNSGIIIPNADIDEKLLEAVQNAALKGPNIRVMVLHLTDYCNLKCKYCFIEGSIDNEYKRRSMTNETMRSAVEFFARITNGKQFPKRPSIVFYGGEPVINWDVIKNGLEHIDQLERQKKIEKTDKILITNGTLINDEIASVLKKHKVMVSVSIDGPKELHDRNRIMNNNRGSFDRVMAGFNALRDAGIRPTVSCVMGKSSIAHEDDILTFLVEDLGIRALGFNHVSIVPNLTSYDPDYENSFAESVLNAQELIQSKYSHVYERRMSHKLNNFIDRVISKADCTGCGEQISVSVNGEVGVCQGYMGTRKTFNNNVFDDNFDPNLDDVFREWSMRSPLRIEECMSCIALGTCGGGCPRNAEFLSGSIWNLDKPFCHFAKKAQEYMIWKKYDALNT